MTEDECRVCGGSEEVRAETSYGDDYIACPACLAKAKDTEKQAALKAEREAWVKALTLHGKGTLALGIVAALPPLE